MNAVQQGTSADVTKGAFETLAPRLSLGVRPRRPVALRLMSDLALIVNDPTREWSRAEPASPAELETLRRAVPARVPDIYLQFLALSDGGEGPLGAEPGWFQIWSSSTVLDRNDGYGVFEALPGFFGFGSNGGGELLAFELSSPEAPVFMVPFIPLEATEAVLVAPSFLAFVSLLGISLPASEGGA